MHAILLAAVMAFPQGRAGQPGSSDRAGGPSGAGAASGATDRLSAAGLAGLDGSWTIVSGSRGGSGLAGADRITVTIRDTTLAFTGGNADQSGLRAMRLTFGPNGVLQVMEGASAGNFESASGAGAGSTSPASPPVRRDGGDPATGTTGRPQQGTPAADDLNRRKDAGTAASGAPGGQPGRVAMWAGVYVVTPDHLAIAVLNPVGGNTGAGTGNMGGADRSGVGAAGTGAGAADGAHPPFSLILRWAGTAGTGTGTGGNPGR